MSVYSDAQPLRAQPPDLARRRALQSVDVLTEVATFLPASALLPLMLVSRSFNEAGRRCLDRKELVLESEVRHFCRSASMYEFAVHMGYEGTHSTHVICRYAAEANAVGVLQHLSQSIDPRIGHVIASIACSNGSLDVLRFLSQQASISRSWATWKRCGDAAAVGSVSTLRWLRYELHPPCPWNEDVCARAAMNGQLATLKWLRSEPSPCPWDESTCSEAALGGHLEVLRWLREANTPPCPWDRYCCEGAACGGHLEVLRWLREDCSPPCPWNKEDCVSATVHLPMRDTIVPYIASLPP